MGLCADLNKATPLFPRPNSSVDARHDDFKPIRTEDFKPEPGAQYKWLTIEPDIFPGEEVVVVMRPEYLAEAEKENPGAVPYLLSEIDALIPHEQDIEFRKKIHLAKKTFGGVVKPAPKENALTI